MTKIDTIALFNFEIMIDNNFGNDKPHALRRALARVALQIIPSSVAF